MGQQGNQSSCLDTCRVREGPSLGIQCHGTPHDARITWLSKATSQPIAEPLCFFLGLQEPLPMAELLRLSQSLCLAPCSSRAATTPNNPLFLAASFNKPLA